MVHAVLARGAPASPRIDITHLVPPHDVRTGALILRRALPWLAGGVVLAVVDPGVATDRRAVALALADGTYMVGPDNGLLLPAATSSITHAVELAVEKRHTFAGRDVFAPAAASLAAGARLGDLGRPVDPSTLAGQTWAQPQREGDTIVAHVVWVDHFGNAQLDVTPTDTGPGPLQVLGSTLTVAGSYEAVAGHRFGLVVDSYGYLSLAAFQASAAHLLGLRTGDEVPITILGPAGTL